MPALVSILGARAQNAMGNRRYVKAGSCEGKQGSWQSLSFMPTHQQISLPGSFIKLSGDPNRPDQCGTPEHSGGGGQNEVCKTILHHFDVFSEKSAFRT